MKDKNELSMYQWTWGAYNCIPTPFSVEQDQQWVVKKRADIILKPHTEKG